MTDYEKTKIREIVQGLSDDEKLFVFKELLNSEFINLVFDSSIKSIKLDMENYQSIPS